MIRIFKNLEEYNTFTNNGQDLVSGDLYWVEDNKSAFFLTNNIDGNVKKYDMLDEIPEGYIVPSGNIAITENGEGIDVKNYATASVDVPIPEGYIVPSGNKEITANGTNIDVKNYATATVNVPSTGGNEDLVNLIERDITTLNIPEGTTKIGESVFCNCQALTSITIPDTVTEIGQQAFIYCKALTEATIGNGVTSIGTTAFYYCEKLTSISIPDATTSIGGSAFSNCFALRDVTIGNGVTIIDDSAFSYCEKLKSITIKATTPPTLGNEAFYRTGLSYIYVPAESVDAYKTATNWKAYADRIQAIREVATGPDDFQHGGGVGEGDTDVPIIE